MTKQPTLAIRNFAQIREVSIEFGDLTVLTGAQGTGKSLALQWLKVANDGKQIVHALKEAGYTTKDQNLLVDLVFGIGMGSAWSEKTAVAYCGKKITPGARIPCSTKPAAPEGRRGCLAEGISGLLSCL